MGPQQALGEMLESVRTITNGTKRTGDPPSTTAFLIPKNTDKYRLIPDPQLNGADPRRPRKFRLPTLESLGRRLAGKGRLYMTKTDLQKCYWSIVLPQQWRRVFMVAAADRSYRVTRLPFGWRYSPSMC